MRVNPSDTVVVVDEPLSRSEEAVLRPLPTTPAALSEGQPSEVTAGKTYTAHAIVQFVVIPKLVFEAEFAEPRTIQQLAAEQREFLASIEAPLEDVELPPLK